MGSGVDARLLELVEQHYELLFRYACRLSGSEADAEDLTQQTFLTAQSRLDQLRETDRAKSWLCTILRNHYLKEYRHKTCIPMQSLESVAEPALESSEFGIDSERLQKVLDELPEEFRTPVILFYFEEFSYKDVAEQMGVPVGTVMSRLSRAKTYLRSRLASVVPSGRTPDTVGLRPVLNGSDAGRDEQAPKPSDSDPGISLKTDSSVPPTQYLTTTP